MDEGLIILVIAVAIGLILWTFGTDGGTGKRVPRPVWIAMAIVSVAGLVFVSARLLA